MKVESTHTNQENPASDRIKLGKNRPEVFNFMSPTKNKLLIKGYLPVRITFPSSEDVDNESSSSFADETFMFVKEHHTGPTLFVCNAPNFPGIKTQILLKSLFGRFGSVARVTVVANPRKAGGQNGG